MNAGILGITRGYCAFALLWIFAMQAAPVHGQDTKVAVGAGEEELSSLKERFEQAYSLSGGDLEKLNASYAAAVKRLFKQQSKAGDLDAAVEIRKEIESFGDGSSFKRVAFEKRQANDVQLQKLRATYLSERERIETARTAKVQPLVVSYRRQLADLKEQLTRSGEIQAAIKARDALLALDTDSRFSPGVGESGDKDQQGKEFEGRLIFLGKGEYEVRVNGERLSYRNASEKTSQYVEFASDPITFRVGDVVSIRMNSPYVFRAFIAAIESEDGTVMAPFRRGDYRMLEKRYEEDAEEVLKLPATAISAGGDSAQKPAWRARKLNPVTRERAEWVAIGSGKEWFSCAVVLTEEMLVPVKPEK